MIVSKPFRLALFTGALLFSIVVADFIAYKFSTDNRSGYVSAVRFWRPLAHLGYSTAQLNLAIGYETGKGVQQDFNKAFKWYLKAAEQGNAIAQNKLGELYELGQDANGQGVPRDIDASFKWYRKSAEQGYPLAQVSLGWMYNSGLGAPQNFREVLKWTRKAAEQDFAEAQFLLGWRYFVGKRVPQDFDAASFWLSKAAQQGHASAKYYMGVIQNVEEVINQTQKSAEQGSYESQYLLGWRYFIGKHVPQDFNMAASWFRKAAEQQQHTAQYYMGLMSEEGKGMPKDVSEALKWYRLAADLGNGDAQIRLEKKLRLWD